jgi:hypothetical protein
VSFLRRVPYWYLLALPTFIFYFGVALNLIVMGLNHAQMPVLWPGGCDVSALADWLNLGYG